MMAHWMSVTERLAPAHETVLARASDGDIYQARVYYGMHEPFWCGHSELNFGVIFSDKGITITYWRPLSRADQPFTQDEEG